jgi:hypothetical protein
MPRAGFQPVIPVFERPKTVLALYRTAIGTGAQNIWTKILNICDQRHTYFFVVVYITHNSVCVFFFIRLRNIIYYRFTYITRLCIFFAITELKRERTKLRKTILLPNHRNIIFIQLNYFCFYTLNLIRHGNSQNQIICTPTIDFLFAVRKWYQFLDWFHFPFTCLTFIQRSQMRY